jgi:hypothetical protein
MKNIILALLLSTSMQLLLAANVCVIPKDSTVIYFGNGINTTRESAKTSLLALVDGLGSEYNGQNLEYAIAYNQTGGIAINLLQSEIQLGAQFDSRFMLWLNGIGLIPDKFAAWYQNYVTRAIVVVAEEIVEHAAFYLTDILEGKKVVVVSHSQGNLYVNEAKILLAKQLRNGKMQSFTVFGVATPSDNVGGDRGPYLTNDRDFIQYVPHALPANWKLFRSDKTSAEDVGPIQAHLFNATYISEKFDVKPQLISGVKTQIDKADKPPYSCESYVKDVMSMVAGNYVMTCGIKPNTRNREMLITSSGLTFPEEGWTDLSGTDAFAQLSVDPRSKPKAIGLLAGGGGTMSGAFWDVDGRFMGAGGSTFCYVDDSTPPTFLKRRIKISQTIIDSIKGIYRFLPQGSCHYFGKPDSYNKRPIEFSIGDSSMRLGEEIWNISGDMESVSAYSDGVNFTKKPSDFTDPLVVFMSESRDTLISLRYSRNMEILRFSAVQKDKSITDCDFNRHSDKFSAPTDPKI